MYCNELMADVYFFVGKDEHRQVTLLSIACPPRVHLPLYFVIFDLWPLLPHPILILQKIPAHKFVLSIGSVVFDAMFNSGLTPQNSRGNILPLGSL